MSDGTNIVPDGPPWEPRDVEIIPDGPPWQPHDVQVYPDGPPWNPIDVPVYPDLPPGGPFQVPTYPDGPPWQPHQVPTLFDTPPADPFDVATTPDGPPWEPTDVQIIQDGPPWAPTDPQIVVDGPAWAPIDVQINPDGPPWSPKDVPVIPDAPPWLPRPLRDHQGQEPQVYVVPKPRTSRELSDALRKYDHQLGNFLDSVGEFVPFVSAAGKGAFDPLILADWLKNYKDAVGLNGMAKFIAEQTTLYAMNPVVARFFDPTYFAKLAVPGFTGMFNTHIDSEFATKILDPALDFVKKQHDKLIGLAFGQKKHPSEPDSISTNVYDPDHTYTEIQDFTVDDMVDSRTHEPPQQSTYLKEVNGIGRFDASKYFESKADKSSPVRGTTKGLIAAGIGQNVATSKLAKSAATNGIIRIPVPGDSVPKKGGTVAYDGVHLSDTPTPDIDDDDVRLPLCFTDLRKDAASDAYRHVFFQPMNLVVNQSFSPQYNESQAFGRTDQIVSYVGTGRTWSVSFELHAFAPEDLKVMYQKMNWLISMVYPTYGSDALMRSGPVCRMRIGDVAATSEGGLPGVIRSLSFDFAECLWELKKGMKVPRSFGVQIDYTVLHDGPVGLLNGMFGVLQLPSGPTTNHAGPTVPNQESTESSNSNSVSIATGRWSRFGEPTRKG